MGHDVRVPIYHSIYSFAVGTRARRSLQTIGKPALHYLRAMLGYLTINYYIDSISVGATKMLD